MTIGVRTASDSLLGFDCNVKLTYEQARTFYKAGFRFVVRYVRRASKHPYDLTSTEAYNIMKAGLGLMIVQHVAPPGWLPNADLGSYYGTIAGKETKDLGVLAGTTVWCDLEGVMPQHPARATIEFCNRWYDGVAAAGFTPGLYVGFGAELTPSQLYKNLKFSSYWGAYNLNKDQYPAVRGVQMQQAPAETGKHLEGVSFQYDVNVVKKDLLGGLPKMMLAIE